MREPEIGNTNTVLCLVFRIKSVEADILILAQKVSCVLGRNETVDYAAGLEADVCRSVRKHTKTPIPLLEACIHPATTRCERPSCWNTKLLGPWICPQDNSEIASGLTLTGSSIAILDIPRESGLSPQSVKPPNLRPRKASLLKLPQASLTITEIATSSQRGTSNSKQRQEIVNSQSPRVTSFWADARAIQRWQNEVIHSVRYWPMTRQKQNANYVGKANPHHGQRGLRIKSPQDL